MNDESGGFVVDLEGFEGPLDLLLSLARAQKVDLRRISILALADQYLAYLQNVQAERLEVAAEYLVMAAWLAFLKSQLLLPVDERDAPEAEGLASSLGERLRRLEAIRAAAEQIQSRSRLGEGRLPRGMPEPIVTLKVSLLHSTLAELFQAYGAVVRRSTALSMSVARRQGVSVEMVLQRLSRQLAGRDWHDLLSFLPAELLDPALRRSAVAAGLVASLELARQGRIDLEQAGPFLPIMIRARPA
jgi:segregation and condensation protein A